MALSVARWGDIPKSRGGCLMPKKTTTRKSTPARKKTTAKSATTTDKALFGKIPSILVSACALVARRVNTTQVIANWLVGYTLDRERKQGRCRGISRPETGGSACESTLGGGWLTGASTLTLQQTVGMKLGRKIIVWRRWKADSGNGCHVYLPGIRQAPRRRQH